MTSVTPVPEEAVGEYERLLEVMAVLRRECPWDAEQTHRSLLTHLVEETCEAVEAFEAGSVDDQCEELGDVLLQVVFHAQIARDAGTFSMTEVARGITDKLVRRHPHVFAGAEVPADKEVTWEAAKRAEKGRTSSLDGIPERLSPVARAAKVIHRAQRHHVDVDLPGDPVEASAVGEAMLALVARAVASGVDPDQALRDAVRALESRIREAEVS